MPYSLPTSAQLKARYSEFSTVADATVDAFIAEAESAVSADWVERDYQPGIIAMAAHRMSVEGIGTGESTRPVGIVSESIDGMSTTYSSEASVLARSHYGSRYLELLARNVGGAWLA